MKVTFKRVLTSEQVEKVVQLANSIWMEHYRPIIGQEQVNYMLDKYQSAKAISKEICDNNNQYYLILKNEIVVGYLGIKLEKYHLYLSKIYVLSSERGSGVGNQSFAFLIEHSRSNQRDKITLTVNKNNKDSIAAYKKVGFEITGDECVDIGSGFVMDDFQMELKVKLKEKL